MLEEEYNNNETMTEGEEGDNKGVWMDGEDNPPDDLRYNGEGKSTRAGNIEEFWICHLS